MREFRWRSGHSCAWFSKFLVCLEKPIKNSWRSRLSCNSPRFKRLQYIFKAYNSQK
ncbi:hypothetical protein KP509_34G069700 [Ceratopteris richardii]|uniref:Uncharacterized protein n=1 Tax=Ceratopteris richardii TaxID=49495 RepID=A0A8T2QLR4_CERRI|nr:hypothetical protein KP509_34G069700 [Ceratopteris richardii]